MSRPVFFLIQVVLLSLSLPAPAQNLPANTWIAAYEGRAGTVAGLTYLPGQKRLLYFGYPAPKSPHADLRLYSAETRDWTEPLAGRGPHRDRGSLTTTFSADHRPGLPAINRPYWMAHQSVYVPPMQRALFFAGGATFTYDPESRRWEHLDIPLDKSPPDVMLGSMAWDPVGKRVILFGGGYISAYKTQPDYIRGNALKGRPWSPSAWTMAEKRATWAFDPATRTWSKIDTGSAAFRDRHRAGEELLGKIETLAGSARGIALEYGDRISGRSAGELAADARSLAAEFAAFTALLDRGDGCEDDYERRQCKDAAVRLRAAVDGIELAGRALDGGDGWKALHALETARRAASEAGEDIAPSPLPRYYGNLVTDTRNGLLVLFGGHGGDRVLADTWIFDPARNQWRQSRARNHPPPMQIPAMSFDVEHGVTLLASGWIYDAGRDEWRRLPLAGPKDFFLPWRALEYDPVNRVHVALTTGDNILGPDPVRVAHLRLDVSAAKPAESAAPRWEWLNDKYLRSWQALPRTQAEYRSRVAAHARTLAQIPSDTWTRLPAPPYSAQDRSYGSFALDPVRGQLVFWGGGHSAYMGNEISQYDMKSNLWLESWPPDMPPWPFGSPDGDGWNPPFRHRLGSSHGYHVYAYSAELDKILFSGQAYDSDRMRWSDPSVRKDGTGTLGNAVDMSGAQGAFRVSAKHWWGAPFGVWKLEPDERVFTRIPRSDTPFATNDRAKPVFDSKRNRILFYGAREDVAGNPPPPANQLYAFDLASATWSKQRVTLEPPGARAPESTAWGIAYSPKHDVLMVLPGGRTQDTWLFDCAANVLRRFGPGPKVSYQGTSGVVYSAVHDLFVALEVGADGIGPVAVHVLRLGK